jgi:hypothetical protein
MAAKHEKCTNCRRCITCGECETDDCHPFDCACRECLLVRPYDDLDSSHCAACGKGKQSRRSFCGKCYYALPPPTRSALYISEGYAETYTHALNFLRESKQAMAK